MKKKQNISANPTDFKMSKSLLKVAGEVAGGNILG
jgi:hypothetical protein